MLRLKAIPLCLRAARRFSSGSASFSPSRAEMNRTARFRLAAAYRGLDKYGLNEGIANHLSAIAPSSKLDKDIVLILPSHLHWTQATPFNLVEVDENDEVVTGEGEPDKISLSSHQAIYRTRPDAKALFHTHMSYAAALSTLKDPKLLMLHQNSTRFYNRIEVDSAYEGVGDASKAELLAGDSLERKDILMVRNHGVFIVAKTIDFAFDDAYYLERAAMIQVLAFSTNRELKVIEDAVAEKACEKILQVGPDYARRHLDTILLDFESWNNVAPK